MGVRVLRITNLFLESGRAVKAVICTMYAQAAKLFTIRRTLSKMLARRAYKLPSSLESETPESFNELYASIVARRGSSSSSAHVSGAPPSTTTTSSGGKKRASSPPTTVDPLAFIATRESAAASGRRLIVFFPNDSDRSNLGISPIRDFVACMKAHECTHAILVVYESLTSPAVFMVRELEAQQGINITYFAENELLFDISEHAYVPRHELLSGAEKEQLLVDLKVPTTDLLPRIQKHDPIARYMGLVVGDVVRIHRYSATVGRDVYYRVVVDSEDFD